MPRWYPQHYIKQGAESGASQSVVDNALSTAQIIVSKNPELAPVFTLRHLAHLAKADYLDLRNICSRSSKEFYRIFRIQKKPSAKGERRFRIICVPSAELMKTQRWIAQRILAKVVPHTGSVAFSKGDTLINATSPHCGATWIIKLDVRNFFESISEIAAYRVFRSLGYQALISFEMARICTRQIKSPSYRHSQKWGRRRIREKIFVYNSAWMGHLPQGAPTSPMLANLAVRSFDSALMILASKYNLIYTRYADDITLSSRDHNFDRDVCRGIIGEVYVQMGKFGLSPNVSKTRIATPGSRKVVLGLLVDGEAPRLTREFRAKMRQHIYYLRKGDASVAFHAKERGFASITGMKNHIFGLAIFARQIEPAYGEKCLSELNKVDWPR